MKYMSSNDSDIYIIFKYSTRKHSDFAEVYKNLILNTDLKIILLVHNCEERLS